MRETDTDSVSITAMVGNLLCVVAMCALLSFLYWFTTDFGYFAPAMEGTTAERFRHFFLSAAGPFGVLFFRDVGAKVWWVLLSVLPLAALAGGMIDRDRRSSRILAYAGVVLWFILGFLAVGVKII